VPDLDTDAIAEKWLKVCGACDVGMYGCTHPEEDYRPVMLDLVRALKTAQAVAESNRRHTRIAVEYAERAQRVVDAAQQIDRDWYRQHPFDKLNALGAALDGFDGGEVPDAARA